MPPSITTRSLDQWQKEAKSVNRNLNVYFTPSDGSYNHHCEMTLGYSNLGIWRQHCFLGYEDRNMERCVLQAWMKWKQIKGSWNKMGNARLLARAQFYRAHYADRG